MSAISSQEIRQLVRDALREMLPASTTKPETGGTLPARLHSVLADPKSSRVEIRMETAADLNAFARDLLGAQENIKAGILSGKIQFSLAQHSAGEAPAQQRRQHQIAKGVVTEIMVAEIGKTSDRLVIGKGVVVTPLARDRAREVKLEIVRERS